MKCTDYEPVRNSVPSCIEMKPCKEIFSLCKIETSLCWTSKIINMLQNKIESCKYFTKQLCFYDIIAVGSRTFQFLAMIYTKLNTLCEGMKDQNLWVPRFWIKNNVILDNSHFEKHILSFANFSSFNFRSHALHWNYFE